MQSMCCGVGVLIAAGPLVLGGGCLSVVECVSCLSASLPVVCIVFAPMKTSSPFNNAQFIE